MDSPTTLYTIGYERRTLAELLELLISSQVEMLLDVRLRPLSRKPGLSKTKLAASCRAKGLSYWHVSELGTPPEIMERVRREGNYSKGLDEQFRSYLDGQGPMVEEAREASTNRTTCLLCYERDASNCHRKIVADRIAEGTSLQIRHL